MSSWVEPVLSSDKCALLKDHNALTPVRLEPAALRSRVKHSTTEPLRSLLLTMCAWVSTCAPSVLASNADWPVIYGYGIPLAHVFARVFATCFSISNYKDGHTLSLKESYGPIG